METFSFQSALGRTVFERADADAADAASIELRRLCGLECHPGGPQRASGLSALRTGLGRFDGGSFRLVEVHPQPKSLRLVWLAAGDTLRVESVWSFDPPSGVIRRQDHLTNLTPVPQHLLRYLMRFPLAMPRRG